MLFVMFLMIDVEGVDLAFHLPVSTQEHIPFGISVPSTLISNSSRVSLSRFQNCSDDNFIAVYEGTSPAHPRVDQKAYVKFGERPDWTLGDSPSPATVCVDATPVGHFEYYLSPRLNTSSHPIFPIQTIPFRVFMNFGWSFKFPVIECIDCDALINSVVLKEPIPTSSACSGRKEQNNSFYHVMSKDNVPIDPNRFRIEISGEDSLLIETFSNERLATSGNQSLALRTPKHLCFYPDDNQLSGQYIGEVVFQVSENDTEALVFFLMFLGIAFPIICIATTMLHCIKLRRQRLWVRSVKEYVQRLQLEQELAERPLDGVE
jgi:hypothetical protein